MPSNLLHNYRAENETDDMQHTAVLSNAKFRWFLQNSHFYKNVAKNPMKCSQIPKALGFMYIVTISITTRSFNRYSKLIHGLLNDAVSS
jgi:hypothetical protein